MAHKPCITQSKLSGWVEEEEQNRALQVCDINHWEEGKKEPCTTLKKASGKVEFSTTTKVEKKKKSPLFWQVSKLFSNGFKMHLKSFLFAQFLWVLDMCKGTLCVVEIFFLQKWTPKWVWTKKKKNLSPSFFPLPFLENVYNWLHYLPTFSAAKNHCRERESTKIREKRWLDRKTKIPKWKPGDEKRMDGISKNQQQREQQPAAARISTSSSRLNRANNNRFGFFFVLQCASVMNDEWIFFLSFHLLFLYPTRQLDCITQGAIY